MRDTAAEQEKGVALALAIQAIAKSGTISRIANALAVRGLIPDHPCSRRDDPFLLVDVELSSDDEPVDDRLLERIRVLVCASIVRNT